jgi:hypothetical protein
MLRVTMLAIIAAVVGAVAPPTLAQEPALFPHVSASVPIAPLFAQAPGLIVLPKSPIEAHNVTATTLAKLQEGFDAANQESPFTGQRVEWMREYVAPTAPAGVPATPPDLPEMYDFASHPATPVVFPPPEDTAPPPLITKHHIDWCYGGQIVDVKAYAQCTAIEAGLYITNTQADSLGSFSMVTEIRKAPGDTKPPNVVITGNARLTSLDGLGALRSAVGQLTIEGNARLVSIKGLQNLASITGVVVDGNPELLTLDGLEFATELTGGVIVHGNSKLHSLQGLGRVTKAGASDKAGRCVQVSSNDALLSLGGLEKLASCADGGVVVAGNAALTDISQLESLRELGADQRGVSIDVVGNDALLSLGTAFSRFDAVRGGVRIANGAMTEAPLLNDILSIGSDTDGVSLLVQDSPALELEGALRKLHHASGSIELHNTGSTKLLFDELVDVGVSQAGNSIELAGNVDLLSVLLTELASAPGAFVLTRNKDLQLISCPKLASLGANTGAVSLVVAHNDDLTLLGFNQLQRAAGGVAITNNDALVSGRLDKLKHVGKSETTGNSIELVGNDKLETVGISTETLDGALKVENNAMLRELPRVKTLGRNHMGQSLVVSNNPALHDLSPLTGLKGALAGSIVVTHNTALELLLGLNRVTTVGSDVSSNSLLIAHNKMLQSLDGLGACSALDGALVIQDNEGLRSLDGLQTLTQIRGRNLLGDSLHIYGNPLLRELGGLRNLHGTLAGAISIDNNKELVSVHGLEGVTSVAQANAFGNAIQITNNVRIANLLGLRGLFGKLGRHHHSLKHAPYNPGGPVWSTRTERQGPRWC